MSVEPTAARFEIRENEWKGSPKAGIARDPVQESYRISGCAFEAKGAVVELASIESDRTVP